MIEVQEAATPLTNYRYTLNAGGAIYGYTPQDTLRDVRTPIRGLYLASAWTNGGGFLPTMIGGRQATEALLEEMNV